MKRLNLTITGRVQNVGFRYHTKITADSLNVNGFVKNLYDGSVYVEVEGEDENVDEFVKWCHQGPPRAIVDNVEIERGELKNFDAFKVSF